MAANGAPLIWLAVVSRWVIAVAFATAAFGKIRGFAAFSEGLESAFGLERRAARGIGTGVLVAELGVVTLLAVGGGWTTAGLMGALVLLCLFAAVISYNLRRETPLVCNCFGNTNRPVTHYDFVRNVVFLAIGIFGLVVRGPSDVGLWDNFMCGSLALSVFLVTVDFYAVVQLFSVDLEA